MAYCVHKINVQASGNAVKHQTVDINVLKRIHGLIKDSPDPAVQRAAGIAQKEIARPVQPAK